MPFDPATLSPAIWLKADALTSLSNGDPVATWTDSSGNGRHLTQATSGSRPTYRTARMNGLPVVSMDGIDDYLAATFGSTYLNTTGMTIYVVNTMRQHSGQHEGVVSCLNSGQSNDYANDSVALFGYSGPTNDGTESYRSSSPEAGTHIPRPPGIPFLLTSGFDATYAYNAMYFSGAQQVDYSAVHGIVGSFAADGISIGERFDSGFFRYPTATDYAEILIFNSHHNSTDRANVEGYLINKWFAPVLYFDNDAAHYAKFSWADVDFTGPLSVCFITHRDDTGDGLEHDHWMVSLYDEDVEDSLFEWEHSGGPTGGGEFSTFVFNGPSGGNSGLGDANVTPDIGVYGKSWEIWFTWEGPDGDHPAGYWHWRNLTDDPGTWWHYEGLESGFFAHTLLPLVSNGSVYVGASPQGSTYKGAIGFIGGWNEDLYADGAGHLGTNPVHTKTSDLLAIAPSSMRWGANLLSVTPAAITDLAGIGVQCAEITTPLTGSIPEWQFDEAAPGGGSTFTQAITITSSNSVILIRRVGKVLVYTETPTSNFVKRAGKPLAYVETPTVNFTKRLGKLLPFAATVTATVKKSVSRILSATATGSVTIAKVVGAIRGFTSTATINFIKGVKVTRSFSSTITPSIAAQKLTSVIQQAITVTATSTSTMVRRVGKVLIFNPSFTFILSKQIRRTVVFSGVITPSVIKRAGKNLAASIGSSSTINYIAGKGVFISATVNTTVTFGKRAFKTLSIPAASLLSFRKYVGITKTFTKTVIPTIGAATRILAATLPPVRQVRAVLSGRRIRAYVGGRHIRPR